MLVPLVATLIENLVAWHRRAAVLAELASDPRRLEDLGITLPEFEAAMKEADPRGTTTDYRARPSAPGDLSPPLDPRAKRSWSRIEARS